MGYKRIKCHSWQALRNINKKDCVHTQRLYSIVKEGCARSVVFSRYYLNFSQNAFGPLQWPIFPPQMLSNGYFGRAGNSGERRSNKPRMNSCIHKRQKGYAVLQHSVALKITLKWEKKSFFFKKETDICFYIININKFISVFLNKSK